MDMEEMEGPGYVICIKVDGAGMMSVGVKEPMEESSEDQGSEMKPVSSMREAMQIAMEIAKNDGKMPDGSEDEAFNAGFGKKQNGPMVAKEKMNEEEGY